MTFSIVIPLYNKRETVVQAIQSALGQRVPPTEIIVVDDGSQDGSPDIVTGFGEPIRLIKQTNAGPAAARNHGARLSSGDFLIFLDADEELLPDCLTEHLACISKQPDTDLSLASFRKQFEDGTGEEEFLADRVVSSNERFEYSREFLPGAAINVVTSGICIRRTLFERIGGFDETLRCWEITDLLMRAGLAARRTGVHRKVTVVSHELRQNSQFVRTRGVAQYRLHLSLKIAKRLHEMPPATRLVMARQTLDIAYSLWRDGHIAEVREIYSALEPTLGTALNTNKLYRLQKLPVLMQRTLLLLRQLAGR